MTDNDPLILSAIGTVLELEGHEIVAANSGQAALVVFEVALSDAKPFDVVITDLSMPEFDGRQLARAVKQRSPGTPVVLLTGWGTAPGAGSSADVDYVLGKPPRLRDVRDALMKCQAARDAAARRTA